MSSISRLVFQRTSRYSVECQGKVWQLVRQIDVLIFQHREVGIESGPIVTGAVFFQQTKYVVSAIAVQQQHSGRFSQMFPGPGPSPYIDGSVHCYSLRNRRATVAQCTVKFLWLIVWNSPLVQPISQLLC